MPTTASPRTTATAPAGFAYADSPYLGRCNLYDHFHPDGRCWDDVATHAALIGSLEARRQAGEILGYAISASADSLRDLLPLLPPGTHVAPWVKPIGVPVRTFGMHNTWEPVLVVGGRQRQPGVRDWLRAQPARGEGHLVGRKPTTFCAWLFDLLGMEPGDRLDDMFPGTRIVGRCWAELSAESLGAGRRFATSPRARGDGAC